MLVRGHVYSVTYQHESSIWPTRTANAVYCGVRSDQPGKGEIVFRYLSGWPWAPGENEHIGWHKPHEFTAVYVGPDTQE